MAKISASEYFAKKKSLKEQLDYVFKLRDLIEKELEDLENDADVWLRDNL